MDSSREGVWGMAVTQILSNSHFLAFARPPSWFNGVLHSLEVSDLTVWQLSDSVMLVKGTQIPHT
jgi:hypothetical protein